MRPDLSRLRDKLRLPFWHRGDIEDEIASHVQDVENEIRAQGTDDAEACRSALERLGDLDSLGDSLQAVHHGWIGGATVQRRFARVLFIAGLIVFAGIGLIATVGKVTDVARLRRGASTPASSPVTGQEWLSGYEFRPVDASAPLTQDELRAAFSELGVTIARFTYEVPYTHRLNFTFQKYVDGKPENIGGGGVAIDFHPGRHSLMLLVRREADTLSYTISRDGDSVLTSSYGPIRGYGTSMHGTAGPVRLVERKEVPVYCFAAMRARSGSMSGFSGGEQPDEMAKRYDMVLVILVELQPIKAIGQR